MKSAVLKELVNKWIKDNRNPATQNGSSEAVESNARSDGYRSGVAMCADQLNVLIELLGD